MKILSLFDGISCARVALERAGIKVDKYFASEVDKFAIKISEKNYPDIVHIGDVKEVYLYRAIGPNGVCKKLGTKTGSLGPASEIDLIIGGSPCQDLSIANTARKGLEGKKSSLFWEYYRILKITKPRYFILENVASMPKKDREMITKALGVEPIMINASFVSAQHRPRLFWTNIEGVKEPARKYIYLWDILEDKDFTLCAGLREARTEKAKQMRRDHKKKYGTDHTPRGETELVMREDGKTNVLTTAAKDSLIIVKRKGVEKTRELTMIERERLQGLKDNYTEGISKTQRLKTTGNAFNVDVVAHILSFLDCH